MPEFPRKPIFICERYRIDTMRRVLFADDERLAVTAKAFDVLVELVERAGEVVSKDELLKAVWPDTVVEENNLTQQISALRKLLGDRAGEHRIIATIPGRGYCFAAPVTIQADDVASSLMIAGSAATSITIDLANTRGDLSFGPFALDAAALRGAALAAVYVVIVCFSAIIFHGRAPVAAMGPRSVGILTFRDLGSGGDLYAAGIRDTLRAKLGTLDDISLRPEVPQPAPADTLTVGREMNLDIVLSGSVQRQDGRIRVAVEIVDVHAARVVWGRTFDDDTANLFGLQDLIADAVIKTLRDPARHPISRKEHEMPAPRWARTAAA